MNSSRFADGLLDKLFDTNTGKTTQPFTTYC